MYDFNEKATLPTFVGRVAFLIDFLFYRISIDLVFSVESNKLLKMLVTIACFFL